MLLNSQSPQDGVPAPAADRRGRRNFVLAGVTSFVATVVSACIPADKITGSVSDSPYSSRRVRALLASGSLPPDVAASLPFPTVLPSGFDFNRAVLNRPDGFRGGASEVALFYVRADSHTRPQNLIVFVASKPTREYIIGCVDRMPEQIEIVANDGRVLSTRYYDGAWVPARDGEYRHRSGATLSWSFSATHSLIVEYNDLLVGIRGSRQHGIQKSDLLAMAASLRANV